MSVRRLALLGLLIPSLFSCSGVPFRQTPLVSLEAIDPERMRQEFAEALPAAFRIVNTVTFRFKRKAFAAIGYTDVDTGRDAFTVVGLHPAGGVKLFEISGNGENVECAFALDEFAERGDVARAVGDDTRRMYFDRLPSASARVTRERSRILFREEHGSGELEYVFAGGDAALVEKRYYEKGRRIWRTSYYEYRRENGKLYPGGIILEHHEYGYRLVVRLREIW